MQSKASSVQEYLDELPEDRRAAISAVRDVINKNLPKGYEEGIQYGHISWFVPHSRYPLGYHCDPKQPLPFASVASQKNHMAVYLFCVYCDQKAVGEFVQAYQKTGKKLDMGASCVRFKKLEDLPLDVLGETIKKMSVDHFIRVYESSLPPAVAAKRAKNA